MTKTSRSPLLLPGRAWALIFGIRVMDPDGWRKDDTLFHETPITYADFRERVWGSTVRDVSYVAALPDTDDDREALRQRTHRGLSGNFLVMRGGPKNGEVIGWAPGVACVYAECEYGTSRQGRFRTHLYEPRPKDGVCYYLGATCWTDMAVVMLDVGVDPRPAVLDMRALEANLAEGYRRYADGVNRALKAAGAAPSTAAQEAVGLEHTRKRTRTFVGRVQKAREIHVGIDPAKPGDARTVVGEVGNTGRRLPIVAVQVPPKKDVTP